MDRTTAAETAMAANRTVLKAVDETYTRRNAVRQIIAEDAIAGTLPDAHMIARFHETQAAYDAALTAMIAQGNADIAARLVVPSDLEDALGRR